MKFGLFYELSLPAHDPRSETDVYHDALDEIVAAERAGFDSVWVVEHHFMKEYSHCSSSDQFLVAAAMRTSRLRLGHGVVLLPFQHPIRVAERAATLDILSRGRLELGVGRGFSPLEYETFGVDMKKSREIMLESLDVVQKALTQDVVTHEGKFFRVPGVTVLPRPVQKPHPPLWTAAVSPESYTLAAERNLGVLAGPFKPLFMVLEDLEAYKEAARPFVPERFAMTLGVFCLEDHNEARRIARDNISWFYRQLLKLAAPVLERTPVGYEYYGALRELRDMLGGEITFEYLEDAGLIVAGDPAYCSKKIRELRESGIGYVLCVMSAGGSPHKQVLESIQTFGKSVIPTLR